MTTSNKMSRRCEDFPCCGHELGCCPNYDEETGEQINMVCVCGASLPVTSRFSICDDCMRDPDEDYEEDPDEDYESEDPDEDYEEDPDEDYEEDPDEDYEEDPDEDYESEDPDEYEVRIPMTTSNKTMVVYAEFPENVRFFLIPSDHPQIAALRTVAGQIVNTVDCSDEAVEVICNAFCAEAEAGRTGWASKFEVKADLVHPCSEAFMVGFVM